MVDDTNLWFDKEVVIDNIRLLFVLKLFVSDLLKKR